MKLSTIIIIVFVTVTLVGNAVGSYYSYTNSVDILEQQVSNHLETASKSKINHVETVLTKYQERARLLTSKTWLRKYLKSYYETGDDEYKILVKDILLNIQIENPKFLHISVISPEGKIIISTLETSVNDDISDEDFFIDAKTDYTISDLHNPIHNGAKLHIAGPLIQDGEFLGVVAVASDGKALENAVGEYTGLGETGESYLLNKDGYMITSSRFLEDTFLKLKIDTENSRDCSMDYEKYDAEEHEHETKIFLNYIGVKTFGIRGHIPEMGWCLLTEISEEEALGNLQKSILNIFMIATIIVITIASLAGLFVSQQLAKQIKKLTSDVDEITKGNLKKKLTNSNIYEFQNLTDSLNRILSSLKLAVKKVGISQEELGLGELKKKKEELEFKYKNLLDNAVDTIMLIDKKGNITDINKAGLKLIGYKVEEIIGKNMIKGDFLTTKSKLIVAANFAKRLAGKNILPYEVEVVTKKGKILPAEVNASAIIKDGKIVGDMAILRDITERKKREKELTIKTKQLERFAKISVDRELEMIKMKKKVKRNVKRKK